MSNNYGDGYQAGVRGEQFTGSGDQAYAGYLAGKEARQRGQPQTHVDGVGFTALLCAPLVCIIYPIAGTAAIATGIVTWIVTDWLGSGKPGIGWQIALSLLLALVAFFPGFAVERRAARLKVYRLLRDCPGHRAGADRLLHHEKDRSCRRCRRDGLRTWQGPRREERLICASVWSGTRHVDVTRGGVI